MYVDACAMNLIRQPEQFDVIVTTNLFGDILSDESSQVVGGLGMAPAANIGDDFALFEPVHGAAFDIAGRNVANPSSFLLSIKMMLDWLGAKHSDSKCITIGKKLESVIFDLVKNGVKTKDIGGDKSTSEFTKEITDRLQ
jgi:3-isopropylmalate dehydrogenase